MATLKTDICLALAVLLATGSPALAASGNIDERAGSPAARRAVAAPDALWLRAREALAPAASKVASAVVTDMEAFDSDGRSAGRARIEERIKGWQDGEPTRDLVVLSRTEPSDVARSPVHIIVDNHPEQALFDGAVERRAAGTFDGKPCAVFAVSGVRGRARYTGKVWVDENSGLPLKAVYDYAGASILKGMTQTITFGRGGDGAWMPTHTVQDVTMSTPFKTMRIVSQHQFKAWTQRP